MFLFQELAVELTGIKWNIVERLTRPRWPGALASPCSKVTIRNDQGFTAEREPGNQQVYIAECLFVP